MTIGIAVYNLNQSIEANLDMVERMGRYLGLKSEAVRLDVHDEDHETTTEIPIRDAIRERRLPSKYYSIGITDIGDNEYVLRNTGADVGFTIDERFGSLVGHSDLLRFSSFLGDRAHKNLLALAKGQYGFAIDWKSDASFWAYACGFEEFSRVKTLRADQLAHTPSGFWGVERNASPEAAIEGKFRDIYELNLITNKHLQRTVHGGTLRDLLGDHDSTFGQLSALAPDWFEWIVPRALIRNVRREFLAAGLLDPRFVDESI